VIVSSLVDDRDRYLGRVFLVHDVTEEREREAELERQNEQLDRFAGVVSHDLRSPLQIASSQVELAKERDDDAEHLESIDRNLDRMEAIVDDVLTLARQGQSIESVDAVTVADVADRAWQSVETGSATLHTEFPGEVLADDGRLTRVFENLFRNSVDHAEPGVTVRVGELAGSDSSLDPDQRGFYVEDDGPGIPEDERATVFEPGETSRDEGTGLGLAIVESIVEAHGWEISVTDGREGGARFEITGVERPGERSA